MGRATKHDGQNGLTREHGARSSPSPPPPPPPHGSPHAPTVTTTTKSPLSTACHLQPLLPQTARVAKAIMPTTMTSPQETPLEKDDQRWRSPPCEKVGYSVRIMGLSGHVRLATSIASHLRTTTIVRDIGRFADGEIKMRT